MQPMAGSSPGPFRARFMGRDDRVGRTGGVSPLVVATDTIDYQGAAGRRLLRILAATTAALLVTADVTLCQTSKQATTSGATTKSQAGTMSKSSTGPATDQPESPKQTRLSAMTLDEMLATGLKDNPDIRVAEAKLREAETQLNRVRLDVAQKIMVFRNAWGAQKAKIDEYEARLKGAESLLKRQAISEEDYRVAQVNLQENRVLLAKLEAELPYLLGRAPQATAASQTQNVSKVYQLQHVAANDVELTLRAMFGEKGASLNMSVESSNALLVLAPQETQAMIMDLVKRIDRPDRQPSGRTRPKSEMEQKILKALDTKIKAKFEDKLVAELLQDFHKTFGIPFVPDEKYFESASRGVAGGPYPKVTFDLDEVPLAIVLQAIEDTAGVYFTVREYGIRMSCVLPGEHETPAVEFWKRERTSSEEPQAAAIR